MELYKGKYQYYYHNNAEGAHFITSYSKTPVTRPNISAMIKIIIAKIIPAMP